MSDSLEGVRDHYRANGLVARLRAALGPDDQPLTPAQLGPVDQFHTGGLDATADIAALAGITAAMSVLDIGSGLGGPARYLAANFGCQVTGIDLSAAFVEAAQYLTERTGLSASASFRVGSALALPFANVCFDRVLLQHVAMNIADRAQLYREVARVLKPGGRFATFDIVLKAGPPDYPVPWARTADTSFLLSVNETRATIEAEGFRTITLRDDSEIGAAWFAALRTAGPSLSPNLGLVMGPDFPELAANVGRGLIQGRIGVITAIFEKASHHVG